MGVWNTSLENRDFYAVPSGQVAVVIPINKQEKEVEIHSYYASFWAETNIPPAFGVNVVALDEAKRNKLKLSYGVYVWAVYKNSPASKVPIYRGDIILSINDEVTNGDLQFGKIVRKNVGKTVKLKVFRNGKTLLKDITLKKSSF